MTPRRDDGGSATAEFAVIVPAVVLLIAMTVGALSAVGRQIRLEHAVAQAARLAARGDVDGGGRVVASIVGGTVGAVAAEGDLVCVSASVPAGIALPFPDLTARSCALAGGR